MGGERHFLGWERYAVDAVCDYLLPERNQGLQDLSNVLVVVPTRQTGRRLREKLALETGREGGAVLAPRVMTPNALLQSQLEDSACASDTLVLLAWTVLLKDRISVGDYRALFPVDPVRRDLAWAASMGRNFNRMRHDLLENGLTISDVLEKKAESLEERERWEDMARLEEAYIATLSDMGFQDPCRAIIEASRNPRIETGVEKVVLAAVADPPPLVVEMLRRIGRKLPVQVLVYAPQEKADWFDEWGVPLLDKWREAKIEVNEPDENILTAVNPQNEARKVIQVIADQSGKTGPNDVTVGVPDASVIEPVSAALEEHGLNTFDPAGIYFRNHRLYLLMQDFERLVSEGSFSSFRAFVGHADVLRAVQREAGMPSGRLLGLLDEFYQRFLCVNMSDLASRLESCGEEYPGLTKVYTCVAGWIGRFAEEDIAEFLPTWLAEIYTDRKMPQDRLERDAFEDVVDKLTDVLSEITRPALKGLLEENGECLRFLLQHLQSVRFNVERHGQAIDLLGWIELLWEDAPLLVVAGMNEGAVPESQVADLFLPDSARREIGLRDDAARLARDLYFMEAIARARDGGGRTCFISARTSSSGDPLKPSRLLFHCRPDALVERAKRLFMPLPEGGQSHAPDSAVQLKPARALGKSDDLDLDHISVTGLADYLRCPFRFYLRRVCGMEPLDTRKAEMDARDFGNLVHKTLEAMGRSAEYSRCNDRFALADFLANTARRYATELYGEDTAVPITFQVEMAVKRLDAFAALQAELVDEDWEIAAVEEKVACNIGGMEIRGKIDRIDRNRADGRIRLIDYKTANNAEIPEKTHLGGIADHTPQYALLGKKAWKDLQLPMYAILAPQNGLSPHKEMELALCHLPKAAGDAGLYFWEGFGEELLESARDCVAGVVADIKAHRFWPPAEKVRYDDYADILMPGFEKLIDGERFEELLKGGRDEG